jgi:hypothetical protein
MNYSTPSLTVYGDSSVLIKGECGWGVENVWLDKTGYYEYWHLECSVTVPCAVFDDCHCSQTKVCDTSQPPDYCKTDNECKTYPS